MQIPSTSTENGVNLKPALDNNTNTNTNSSPTTDFPSLINGTEPNAGPKLLQTTESQALPTTEDLTDATAAAALNPLLLNLLLSSDLNKPVKTEAPVAATLSTENKPVNAAQHVTTAAMLANSMLPAEVNTGTILEKNITKNNQDVNNSANEMLATVVVPNPVADKLLKTKLSEMPKIDEPTTSLMPTNLMPTLTDISVNPLPVAPLHALQQLQQNPQLVQSTSKGVNALLQLGHLINSHTAPLANPVVNNNLEVGEMDYTKTAARVAAGNLETQIELQPQVLDGIVKNTINANIKIYPPELGHVLAKLKFDDNNAELVIMTENSTVRQIVETNLPQLRDSFLQADINLTNVEVHDNSSEKNRDSYSQSNQQVNPQTTTSETAAAAPQTSAKVLNSLVDTYA